MGVKENRTADGRLTDLPNDYDMFWLQNVKQVLGSQLWMWPFPFNQEMRGQGLYFPRVPEVTPSQIRALTETEAGTFRPGSRGYSGANGETDPNQYIEKAVKKYAGNTFVLPVAAGSDGKEGQ